MSLQSQLLAALLFISSISFSQNSIDTNVVLHVGNISITGYELEKNLAIFKDGFRQKNNRLPGPAEIDQWIQSFVDRTYLLADAYRQRYDTFPETNRWVTAMEHFMIMQPGGLLDEKLGGELSEQEAEAGIQKHLRRTHFQYIKFPDQVSALTVLGNTAEIKTKEQFDDILKKGAALPGVTTGEDLLRWPFFSRGEREEIILNMREGEISSLLTLSDGIYIARVQRIELIDSRQLTDNMRQGIVSFLKRNKRDQAYRKFYEESMQQAQIRYDDVFLAAIKDHLSGKGSIRSFENNMFADLRSRTLITYQLDNTTKQVSADRWMNYFNDLPMRQLINPENLAFYLQSIVFDDYAYHLAKEIGVTKETKFILDKENYIKSIVWVIYEREVLKKGITVTEEDILQVYQQTKNDYVQATDAVITTFSFPDRGSAVMERTNIRTGKTDSLQKGKMIEQHRSIRYNDDLFSDSVRAAIFSMKVNDLSVPLYNKGNYLIIIKEAESGSRTRELQEVRPLIMKKIEEEKLEQKKQLLVIPLKKQYAARYEIDHSRYYAIVNNGKG
jgi:hypothetical protein